MLVCPADGASWLPPSDLGSLLRVHSAHEDIHSGGMQGLLREKALNTGELLRHHRLLKEKYELTAGELEEERTAREDAGAEVKLAKQSLAESAK